MTALSLNILSYSINLIALSIKGTFMSCFFYLFQNRLMNEEHVKYKIKSRAQHHYTMISIVEFISFSIKTRLY